MRHANSLLLLTAALQAWCTCSSTVRLDAALVSRGLLPSRAAAKTAIQDGRVCVRGSVVKKASEKVDEAAIATLHVVEGDEDRFVSRAGHKLQAALDAFSIDLSGCAVLDIGASTGGFTDCALAAGATSVVCVDNGHDQLAAKLHDDPRVTNLEGLNARSLTADMLPRGDYDCVVVDVSFISLSLILPAIWPLLDAAAPSARLIALVKPQFEAQVQLGPEGREALDRGKGVLSDETLQLRCMQKVSEFAVRELDDCAIVGTMPSPLKGSDGNAEFLLSLAVGAHKPRSGPLMSLVAKESQAGGGASAAAAAAAAADVMADTSVGALEAVTVTRPKTSAARAAQHNNKKRKKGGDGVRGSEDQ